jgi:outer membrane protein TolC
MTIYFFCYQKPNHSKLLMSRVVIVLSFIFLFADTGFTQTVADADRTVLPFPDFLYLVQQNHPVAKQSLLFNRTAQAELLSAKGGFDPKLFGDYEQKYFDSKNYFALGEYGVKIPTWYGIDLKSSYNTAEGVFISPENRLPQQGQIIAGLSFPVLQNLKIDERRANLFKARQAQQFYQAERAILTNDLAFEAAQIYWKWAFCYQQMVIFREAFRVSDNRFIAIKQGYILGERMAMDTLESFTQVQDRLVEFNQVQLDFQEAELKLINFLWGTDNQPLANSLQKSPQSLLDSTATAIVNRQILLDNVVSSHPVLRGYAAKINQLEIDKKLKREKLKPKLNLNYNFLSTGSNWENVFNDNYKWGVTFSTSTFLRSERGEVQLADIKIENTQLLRDQKALELKNKLQQFFNETDNLQNQINVYRSAVQNYQQLLQLENTRFELGESSFFLINSRENKYIESQIKLAKLLMEYQIAKTGVDWAGGNLAF